MWYPSREDSTVIFPAISQLGVKDPERHVYRCGFVAVGLLLVLHVYILSTHVIPIICGTDLDAVSLGREFVSRGYQAAIGAAMQGFFTLELRISTSSIIHWIGAAMFMHGAISHAHASTELYASWLERSGGSTSSEGLRYSAYLRETILRGSSIVMFAPVILSQIFIAVSGANREAKDHPANNITMNAMGLMQWLVILQFSLFFASYSVDIFCLA